jgi:hypothetical protein
MTRAARARPLQHARIIPNGTGFPGWLQRRAGRALLLAWFVSQLLDAFRKMTTIVQPCCLPDAASCGDNAGGKA